jgi:membrane fusion protein (multidrug efflux system)
MKKRMFFTLLGLAVVFGGVFGYNWFVAYKTQQFMANRPAPTQTVTATTAQADTWQPSVKSVGSVTAVQGVDITAEVTGKVVEVAVEDGAEVEAGQTLVQLDADGLRAELRGARAEARLAEIELERQQRLRRQNANSEADVDRAESELEQARAAVDRVRSELDKKTIEAPFAGRLGIIEVDAGQFVDIGEPIVTLQTLDPINVDFTLPQQELARVRLGQPVRAEADAFSDRAFEGEVRAISPKVNQQTRNVAVRGRLANPEGRLRPGMFVDVAVQLPTQENVITLPQTAVTYNPYGDSVFLINESDGPDGETQLTVERKFIRTGANRGDQVQILEGVNEGDRVVTSGQLKLRNGSKVKIAEGPEPANEASPEVGNY